MTNVLVAVASKYGATHEIAEAIGRKLRERCLETHVQRVDRLVDLDEYDAFILGSAVYAGHWLEPARRLVDERGHELVDRPIWLVSSGPIGDPPRPSAEEAVQIDAIVAATRAEEHRVFPGKLDKSRLSFAERALVFAFRANEGDFRDWEAIATWAAGIADAVQAGRARSTQPSSSPSESA